MILSNKYAFQRDARRFPFRGSDVEPRKKPAQNAGFLQKLVTNNKKPSEHDDLVEDLFLRRSPLAIE